MPQVPVSKSFVTDKFVKQREEQEQKQHEQEIVQMFQTFSSALACDAGNNQGNQFVSTFYNRYPKDFIKSDPKTVQFFQEHIPKTVIVQKEVEEQVQP